jgi:hypothetical protein
MEKFTPKNTDNSEFNAGVNFERIALSELEAIARSTGKTVEEVIENNRQTNPNL